MVSQKKGCFQPEISEYCFKGLLHDKIIIFFFSLPNTSFKTKTCSLGEISVKMYVSNYEAILYSRQFFTTKNWHLEKNWQLNEIALFVVGSFFSEMSNLETSSNNNLITNKLPTKGTCMKLRIGILGNCC